MVYALIDVQDPADWSAYHAIRRQELFEARGRYGVYDENYPGERGPDMYPFLLKLDDRAIGTTRLDVRSDGTAIFRLVAITSAFQGQGHGRALGLLVEERARDLGTHTLYVNAAVEAHGFYLATGWSDYEWDVAERVGLASACIQMRKHLA